MSQADWYFLFVYIWLGTLAVLISFDVILFFVTKYFFKSQRDKKVKK